jgi:formate hydrogenlyase subunit 3/multisubunit Na+/H+ antiporter MnhD subunit
VTGGSSGGQLLLLTVLGLLGMVVGASLALTHIQRPGWSAAALSLALVSVIAMIGTWAGSGAVLASTRVLILGLGGLFIVAGWQGTRPKWLVAASLIFVAALAGLPLTAGFYGLASLYNAWFTDGRFIVVLAVALLFMLLIAAGTAIAWPKKPGEDRILLPPIGQAQYGFALMLLVIGLFALPGLPLSDIRAVTWLAILIPAVAGFALSRYISQVHDVQDALRGAFHLNLPVVRLGSAFERLLAGAGVVIRESAAILEGEGGLLWLLILVVVLWLARRG